MLPRITILGLALFLSFLAIPNQASAQILEEDENSYIYKGFHLSAEYGLYVFALKPSALTADPTTGRGPNSELIGSMSGFDLGFDLSEMFALEFSFGSLNIRGNSQDGGGNTTILFNLGAMIYFVKSRLTFYARVGAGFMLTLPSGLVPPGLMTHLGLGVRFYTRLKHFSIALEARALLSPPIGGDLSLGIGLIPSLTYTF